MIVDSFLIENGECATFDLHWQRFARSVQEVNLQISEEQLQIFRKDVLKQLAGFTGFPRIEFYPEDQNFNLILRPTPPINQTTSVLIGEIGDPRKYPRLKGPDLGICADLIERAKKHGCDEYLIRDDAGMPLECAYSALAWWDGDALCFVDEQLPILPSVTRRVLMENAKRDGTEIRLQRPTIEQLKNTKTLLLNARHGIRMVQGWR